MVVWNSMLLKIVIISPGVVKQHVRFIVEFFSKITALFQNSVKI